MNRRSTNQTGFVNFPISDPRFKASGEGGMFVRLVVEPNESFMVCSGGYSFIFYDETYIADHNRPRPASSSFDELSLTSSEEVQVSLENEMKENHDYDSHHFPRMYNPSEVLSDPPYVSRRYLCAMTIGSTGWAGFDEKKGEYWICQESDLSTEGRTLLKSIKKLYPGCKVRLQTWLDT